MIGNGLELPKLGFGTGPIGGISRDIDDRRAREVIQAAWDGGQRYFDTAPWYGNTNSEHRIGAFLRGQPRSEFMLSTKVGRLYRRPAPGEDFEASPWRARWPGGLAFYPHLDYTRAGILRSYEDSLQRLGLNRVDALTIHDLDSRHHKTPESIDDGFRQLEAGGGFAALAQLKRSGEINAIGVGINLIGFIPRFLANFDIDYFLVAGPYTLLNQDALKDDFPACAGKGAKVIIGAPFGSGILATGSTAGAQYLYTSADDVTKARVSKIEALCARYGISLAAAALQFTAAHDVVAAVIPGADKVEHVKANIASFKQAIPAEFWADMKRDGLLAENASVPS